MLLKIFIFFHWMKNWLNIKKLTNSIFLFLKKLTYIKFLQALLIYLNIHSLLPSLAIFPLIYLKKFKNLYFIYIPKFLVKLHLIPLNEAKCKV